MKFLILPALLLSSLISWSQLTITDPHAEVRSIPEYHAIKVAGPIDVLMTKGNGHSIAVSATDGQNHLISTQVKDGVLTISLVSTTKKWTNASFKAYVSYVHLNEVALSGAATGKFSEAVEQDKLAIQLAGASELTLNARLNQLTVQMKGASELKAGGAANELTVTCSGASDLKATNLIATKATIVASGASGVKVSVSDYLNANATGASDILYRGMPKTQVAVSGASSVSRKD